MTDPKIICNETMLLGEGPLWHPLEKCLYWVDIVGAALYRLNPQTQQLKKIRLPSSIGSIAWRKKGGLVAALNNHFALIDVETGETQPINYPLRPGHVDMFNDGKCDRGGRFWAGTKDIAEKNPTGALYCLNTSRKVIKTLEGFTVSNGIAWSPDNTKMYLCDSPKRQIYQYEFDVKTGKIGNFDLFVKVPDEEGFPDGLTVDSEGYVWSCHWDAWQITRYTPKGNIDSIFSMPVPRPTSCCFGGTDLKTLYVTSASIGLSAASLVEAPLSGQVFALSLNVQGIEEPPYLG